MDAFFIPEKRFFRVTEHVKFCLENPRLRAVHVSFHFHSSVGNAFIRRIFSGRECVALRTRVLQCAWFRESVMNFSQDFCRETVNKLALALDVRHDPAFCLKSSRLRQFLDC